VCVTRSRGSRVTSSGGSSGGPIRSRASSANGCSQAERDG
jgi:hypothetical protein